MDAVKFQLGNCYDNYLTKKSVQVFRLEDLQKEVFIALIEAVVRLEEHRKFIEGGGDLDDWSV